MNLRPYQEDLVGRCEARARRGERVVAVAPTGAGKTVIMAELCARLPGRVLILAPWRVLIPQTVSRLAECGVDAAPLMSGLKVRQDARVQVASLETVVAWATRLRWLEGATVLVDEAHRVDTDRRRAVLVGLRPRAVVGVTATPWTDRGGLGATFEALEVGPSVRELIAYGVLRAPVVYALDPKTAEAVRKLRPVAGDFRGSDLEHVERATPYAERVVQGWQSVSDDWRVVAFASSVAGAKQLETAFRVAGTAPTTITAATGHMSRAAAFRAFEEGRSPLCNCNVLVEGFDARAVGVICRPTASLRAWIQMVGRGLRTWEDAPEGAPILDPGGNASRLGLPDDDLYFSLDRAPEPRPSEATPCKKCQALVRPGADAGLHTCGWAWREVERLPLANRIARVAGSQGWGAPWAEAAWLHLGSGPMPEVLRCYVAASRARLGFVA